MAPPSLEQTFCKEKVIERRSYAVEATIVRIMKSHKTLAFNKLTIEVMRELRNFKPDMRVKLLFFLIFQVIKSNIQKLIERDYIKVDEDDNLLLHYIA